MRPAVLATLLALAATAQAAPPKSAIPARPSSDAPWKIEDAHGPAKTIAFETDSGTWLAADLHPDGQQVVFSLLGDLYVMPLAGGAARRITSGPAYDVQPRFSPDGKQLAYASHRGGT